MESGFSRSAFEARKLAVRRRERAVFAGIALAAVSLFSTSSAFGAFVRQEIPERKVLRSSRETLDEWGFLASLARVTASCEKSPAEEHGLSVQGFRRDYWGKVVTDGEAGRVVGVGEIRRMALAERVNSFRFCDAELDPMSTWVSPQHGLAMLVQELGFAVDRKVMAVAIDRELLGVSFRYVLATDRPEMVAALESLRLGGMARAEFVILGTRNSSIDGALTSIEEMAAPPPGSERLKPVSFVESMESAADPKRDAEAPKPAPIAKRRSEQGPPPRTEPLPIRLSDGFRLRIGERGKLGKKGFELRFVDVVKDERCPRSAACTYSGPATVRLELTGANAAKETIDLAISLQETPEIKLGSFRLRMTALLPRPDESGAVEKSAYAAELVIDLGPPKKLGEPEPPSPSCRNCIDWEAFFREMW